jgi:hypothetical protein
MLCTLDWPAMPDPGWERPEAATSWTQYRVCNIGNSQPVSLLDFVATLESIIGKLGTVAITVSEQNVGNGTMTRLHVCLSFLRLWPSGVASFLRILVASS